MDHHILRQHHQSQYYYLVVALNFVVELVLSELDFQCFATMVTQFQLSRIIVRRQFETIVHAQSASIYQERTDRTEISDIKLQKTNILYITDSKTIELELNHDPVVSDIMFVVIYAMVYLRVGLDLADMAFYMLGLID